MKSTRFLPSGIKKLVSVGVPEAPAPVAVVDAELSRLTSAAWTTEAEPTLKPSRARRADGRSDGRVGGGSE
jgi:hypothetical protein